MTILENISWAPDGPTTSQQAPAYLYNVNRAPACVGRSTPSDIALLPAAAHTHSDASVTKIHGERSNKPLFPDQTVPDSKHLHRNIIYQMPTSSSVWPNARTNVSLPSNTAEEQIQFDAETRSALEQARGDSRREAKTDPDFGEFEDIRIEMPAGETSVDNDDAETQGLIQRLLANSLVSYFLRKSAIVFPGFTAFDYVVTAAKQSMGELVALFYTDSPENTPRRSTEEKKQVEVSPTDVAPRNVHPAVRHDIAQVAPVFCMESQEDDALRRAREVHKVKFQGQLRVSEGQDLKKKKPKAGNSSSVMF